MKKRFQIKKTEMVPRVSSQNAKQKRKKVSINDGDQKNYEDIYRRRKQKKMERTCKVTDRKYQKND